MQKASGATSSPTRSSPSTEKSTQQEKDTSKMNREKLGKKLLKSLDKRNIQLEEVNALIVVADLGQTDRRGESALHKACELGHLGIVEALVDHDAAVNAPTKKGWTPLYNAIHVGKGSKDEDEQLKIVNCLLSNGATIDPGERAVELTPLHMALIEKRPKIAEVLVKDTAVLNRPMRNGERALQLAINGGYPAIAMSMIQCGADVNVTDSQGYTPLHLAIQKGYSDVAIELLRYYADVTIKTPDGKTALHLVIENELQDVALRLITYQNCGVNEPSPDGLMPLHMAIMKRQEQVSIRLFDYYANPMEKTLDGKTPLLLAIEHDLQEFANKLISYKHGVNEPGSDGRMPFHQAIEKKQEGVAKQLFSYYADPMAKDPKTQMTPLCLAILNGLNDLASQLISYKHGINDETPRGEFPIHLVVNKEPCDLTLLRNLLGNVENVDAADATGSTALHIACKRGNLEAVDVLLSYYAETNVLDFDGRTPLYWATHVKQPQLEMVRNLLKKAANPNLRGDKADGVVPLHSAAQAGRSDVVRLLLTYNADHTLLDQKQQLALHWAVSLGGDTETVRLLLEAGEESVHLLDDHNQSPMHLAVKYGHVDIVRLLRDHDANANDRDNPFGRTALHYAANSGNVDVMDTLLDMGSTAIDQADNHGQTALHWASMTGRDEIVRKLLGKGANTGLVNKDDRTCRQEAEMNQEVEVLKVLDEFDAKATTTQAKTTESERQSVSEHEEVLAAAASSPESAAGSSKEESQKSSKKKEGKLRDLATRVRKAFRKGDAQRLEHPDGAGPSIESKK